ncbi:hypothetical protein [Pseudoalteromonas porphyrae]|nr:hypothetical protein [Pseudoalteromonas porphyrae]NMR26683.1 hypothetical protein [Pseudoalteromonas sp. NEC-BIFX-2020_015]
MMMKTITAFCLWQSVVCSYAFAHITYVNKSPLNIQRYFTTKIVNELSDNKFELIYFDSNLDLLSHQYFEHNAVSIQCIIDVPVEQSNKYGNAYKYWNDGNVFQSCATASTDFFSISESTLLEAVSNQNIIVLHVPNRIKPDLLLHGNLLVERAFKLMPLTEFHQAYPEITKLLKRNRRLIVGQGKHTFQLYLVVKRN